MGVNIGIAIICAYGKELCQPEDSLTRAVAHYFAISATKSDAFLEYIRLSLRHNRNCLPGVEDDCRDGINDSARLDYSNAFDDTDDDEYSSESDDSYERVCNENWTGSS